MVAPNEQVPHPPAQVERRKTKEKQTWTGHVEIEDRMPGVEQSRAWREFWDEQYARTVQS